MTSAVRYLTAILAPVLLQSCGWNDVDAFFVRRAGADVPVWVAGNTQSKTFVVMVAGGPGDPGLATRHFSVYRALEKQYAFVYWDQRTAGLAQGNPPSSTFTLDDLVEDLRGVLTTVRVRYPVDKLILHAHSWGGEIGTAYLIKYAGSVDGYIDVDGIHDWQKNWDFGLDALSVAAQMKLDRSEDVAKWQAVLDWISLKRNRRPTPSDSAQFGEYWAPVGFNEALEKQTERAAAEVAGDVSFEFFSPFSPAAYLFTNSSRPLADKIDSDPDFYASLNQSAELSKINAPTLIIWGRHDAQVHFPMAQDMYNHVGTPPELKSLTVFEQSAHHAMVQEPERYREEVTRFVSSRR